MGCIASAPMAVGEDQQTRSPKKRRRKRGETPVPISASTGHRPVITRMSNKPTGLKGLKAKFRRLRRLSYVRHGKGPPIANSTRLRRLSYVSHDVEGNVAQDSPDVRMETASYSRAGEEPNFKKANQDACFAFEKYMKPQQSLYGAFDGHGPNGHMASSYVKHHLPLLLVSQLNSTQDTNKALINGFLQVNEKMTKSCFDCDFSGTTAVVSLLKDNTLHTAWVGDSRAVLGRRNGNGKLEAMDLTTDHLPSREAEKTRIIASNGRVERLRNETGQPVGPYRVWLPHSWSPGLAMSRAIGDVVAHRVGVTAEPSISVHKISSQDEFIILASDGVWEFVSSAEAVEIVSKVENVDDACRKLVDEAYQRWQKEEEGVVDDTTAVVVKFIH